MHKVKQTSSLKRRKTRIRSRIAKRSDIRLSVHRTPRHIYAQVVSLETGNIIASASTLDKEIKEVKAESNVKLAKAYAVGKLVAERAKEKGIATVAFDRGGYIYHGRIAELAKGAREADLKF